MNDFLSYRDSAKMAVGFFRTCLYSVREHGKHPKNALLYRLCTEKLLVIDRRSKMADGFFRTFLCSVREHGKHPKIALFVQTLRKSCW